MSLVANRISSFVFSNLSAKGRVVSSRPYIYISGWGLKRNIARDDDIISKLATDVKYMGAENLPYVKKEFLKPKERRYMLANSVVGKRANYKLQGLKDVVAVKRKLRWQH